MYHPKYFTLGEIFHPDLARGGDRMWELIHERILTSLDRLRSAWGSPIIINQPWDQNGRKYAGVRPIDSAVGAMNSRHKMLYNGVQAFDLIPAKGEVKDLFDFCEKHFLEYQIVRLESFEATKNWVHVEFSKHTPERLHIFLP